ncbi:MAG: hypothetical protein ACUVQG_14885, partial [Thermogutta sp.]
MAERVLYALVGPGRAGDVYHTSPPSHAGGSGLGRERRASASCGRQPALGQSRPVDVSSGNMLRWGRFSR